MGTPRSESYTAASGGSIYAGINAPSASLPAWLAGKALNTWFSIANTVSSSILKDYSGIAVRQEAGLIEVAALLMGGHQGNYFDNTPYTINLKADVPVWTQRRAAGNSGAYDPAVGNAYYSDGTPAPRHTYWDIFWCPERSKYIVGGRFWGSSAQDRNTNDGFTSPSSGNGAWDAAGTWAQNPGGLFRGGRDPTTGIRYCGGGAPYKWVPGTDTWSTWPITGPTWNRGAMAWDSTRSQFYHLSTGDNFATVNSTVSSVKVTRAGVSTAVTFNSSAGYTDFIANAANFLTVALDYDADSDCFYFYDGRIAGQTAKIYKIKPNSGNVWDMELMAPSGTAPPAIDQGANNRFFYVSSLRTVFLIVPNQNVYFVKLA